MRLTFPTRSKDYLTALCLSLTLLSGCATLTRLPAVPAHATEQAAPSEGPVRFYVDQDPAPLLAEVEARRQREIAERARTGQTGPLPPEDFLAISGGGDDGAFGAGLIAGWTQAGNRPVFNLVTGVSTGALIAPFAFLGPKYDWVLRETYTKKSRKDIFRPRDLLTAFFSDAFGDTRPLASLIQHYITPAILAEIASEYYKGRLLFIGTTDLDSRRGVIWNMGAIAASKDPEAPELFRKVVLASASIPGAFPPVMIDVTVDGKHHQEMHVDGGATNQVFMYPESLDVDQVAPDLQTVRERKVYVIRNSRLDPDWASTDRQTLKIVGRSVASLIHSQALGDILRIYVTAERDKIDFNLAFIPRDFNVPKNSDFDPAYMAPLFKRGYDMGVQGYPWEKTPPGFAGPEDADNRTTVQ
jgi:predicted acylesterase/phospholipase RssA